MARKPSRSECSRFPPIADYAFPADRGSSARVAPSGALDWLCLPRFDGRVIPVASEEPARYALAGPPGDRYA